jgi:hypothetical protein
MVRKALQLNRFVGLEAIRFSPLAKGLSIGLYLRLLGKKTIFYKGLFSMFVITQGGGACPISSPTYMNGILCPGNIKRIF